MCGIFGIIGNDVIPKSVIKKLANFAFRRGQDSSGILTYKKEYKINKADYDINKLVGKINKSKYKVFLGIGRLITNGNKDNQPYYRYGKIIFHNGIIVNDKALFKEEKLNRYDEIDTEIIAALIKKYSKKKGLKKLIEIVLSKCIGTISAAIAFPDLAKLVIFSNNGSLYFSKKKNFYYFSSELYHLKSLGCENILKLNNKIKIIDIPKAKSKEIDTKEFSVKRIPLVSNTKYSLTKEKLLLKAKPTLVRCTKCLLPHTMPYISFDKEGVCNYCKAYISKNIPKPLNEFLEILKPFKKNNTNNCIVPFSGGRDSSYALHLIINELDMKPITYTYDWGMTADIGRRNISIMCSKLGIENIIVAADIIKKRDNIKKNVLAWLKNPNLGMVSIFTAGDKHFFNYIETIKKETGISLNLWGNSPFEVTHFKAGFLGINPDFQTTSVYQKGLLKQIKYQSLRFKNMIKSPSYFNSSLWDTLSGEYYRSIKQKNNYHYVFDYWKWDEKEIEETLINDYDWQTSKDTKTSWRIGDGTAAFYNYIYYTIAGFTEHDTFRSNQIREGEISRAEALKLVEENNLPRYESLAQYFDLIGIEFDKAIKIINNVPKLWHQNPRY
ncbi:MAG: glucosamine 6-phosphate synthetase [Pelagibacterales bacterium]|nr:glucosamine 6-phosphate synthetase [Pelagibacterales bacterium]